MRLFPIMTVGLAVATIPALAEEATLRDPANRAAGSGRGDAAWWAREPEAVTLTPAGRQDR